MPQLNTSTWFITILSMILTLFILFQSKLSNQIYPLDPSAKNVKPFEFKSPWENKWTKIYLPLSTPQQ